jgi:hypothetical protein
MNFKKTIGLALLSFLLIGQSANASLITLDEMGSAFTLTYDSSSIGLFGTPSLSHGSIAFSPNAFNAQATTPSFTDLSNSTIVMTLSIKDGYQFNNIALTERGDYVLNDGMVKALGQIRVHDKANVLASEATDFISTTSGAFINDFNLHNWEATAGVDQSTGSWYKGKEITLTLENLLIAQMDNSPGFAFIEKKLVALQITTTAVPLPTAALFLITGLLSLLPGATRKRKA